MIDGAPLSLLPHRPVNWSSLTMSFGAQALAVIVLVKAGIVQPQKFIPAAKQYRLTALVSTPPPQRPAPRPPRALLPAVPPTVARLTMPVTAREAVKPPEFAPRTDMPQPALSEVLSPAAPRRTLQIVRTGAFDSTGSQAVATVNKSARDVQTGGFGDPNGIKGEGKPGAKAVVASLGSFDLPSGPGYGNGTGGAHGVRGTVASVGFGNGIAIGNSDRSSGGSSRAIAQAGFGDARPAEAPRAPRPAPVAYTTSAVQILSKPNPIYTDEARRLRVEGEVLVEVTFTATGECHVLRVLRGLGHGLDEAAVRAAEQIRFRPATRNGQPVDSTASLHVVFQLAY